MFPVLAVPREPQLFVDLLPVLIGLLVLVVIGGAAMFWARRAMKPNEESTGDGFTLHGLRQMHAAGQLSDDEYARARSAMIGRVRGVDPMHQEDHGESPDADDPGAGNGGK